MRFDPQANMVSGDGQRGRGRSHPQGLRASALLFVMAVAGTLGFWIYSQSNQRPPISRAAASDGIFGLPNFALHNEPVEPELAVQAARNTTDRERSANGSRDAAISGEQMPHDATMDQTRAAASVHDDTPLRLPFNDSRRRHSSVLYQRGQSAMSGGRYAEAAGMFRESIALHADFADAHYALGLAYIMSGDQANARAQEHRLRELNPNLANLLRNLLH